MNIKEATALAERQLAGGSIFIPKALAERLPERSRQKDGQEITALLWCFVRNLEKRNEDRPVSVRHRRFRAFTTDQTAFKVKKWLVKEGFLTMSSGYQENARSKTYTTLKRESPVELKLERKNALSLNETHKDDDRACKFTRECLNRITVDVDAATQVLAETIVEYMDTSVLTENARKPKKARERRVEDLYGLAAPVTELMNKNGSVFRGINGRRLFSPMTQLKRTFRPCLKLDGKPLGLSDMVCAAPTLLAHKTKEDSFLNACLEDTLYGEISAKIGSADRDDGKEPFCQWAYGGNRKLEGWQNDGHKVLELMRENYPETEKYVWQQKLDNYKTFSHRSQAFEAEQFIDGILMELCRKNIIALSIHDCLISKVDDAKTVLKIAHKHFEEKGIRVRFKRD